MPEQQTDAVSVMEHPRLATVWHGVGTLYSLLCTAIALSTTLYFAVSKDTPSHTQFHEIFFVLLYMAALLAMAFVFWVSREQEEPNHSEENGKVAQPEAPVATIEWPDDKPKAPVLSDPSAASAEEEEEEEEGFNVYLRIGLVVFVVGIVSLNVIRLISHAVHAADGCFRPWRVAVNVFELLFVCVQVTLLLLRHRTPLGLRLAPLCRVALCHVFTANLCLWFYSIVGEIKEHVLHLSAHGDSHATSHNASNATSHGTTAAPAVHEDDGADCSGPLLNAVNPFLSPTVIEFCLLAAAMSLKLLLSVDCRAAAKRLQHQQQRHPRHQQQRHRRKLLRRLQWEKAKDAARRVLFSQLLASHTALAFSVVAVIVAIVGTVLLYTMPFSDVVMATIYLSQEIVLVVCGSVLAVLASLATVKLSFARVEKHSFDHSLLLFAQFGTCVYQTVMLCTLIDHFDSLPKLLNTFDIVTVIVSMIQQLLQTHCLLDGLRRRVTDRRQAKEAPGRTAYLALLGVNLALWIIETFEVRKTEEVLLEYDLHEVWALAVKIIVHIGQPISIFYRFHSTVCLSVVWSRAYQAKEESFVDFTPPSGTESVG